MALTFETLLDLLTPARRPVADLWKDLGVTRAALQRFLDKHRDALAAEGVLFHTATVSQAAKQSLYLTIDGRRVAALSLPVDAAPLAPVEAAPPVPAPPVELVAADCLAGPIAVWLDSKAGRSGSTRTRDAYRTTLADARAALAAVGLDLDSDPRAVALALQGWSRASKVEGRSVRPSTVAQRLAVVSSFYDFTIKRGLLPGLTANPVDMVERPQVEQYDNARPLDPGKVRRVLGQLRTEAAQEGAAGDMAARDMALLRVALTTGRRVAELAALRWRDVEVTGGGAGITLNFQRAKGGKVMRDALAGPVAADLLTWLHRHYGAALGNLDPDAPLWPALRHGGKVGRARLGTPLSADGLAEIVARRLDTHPHALRHSFAHGMRKAGAKDSEVQARLGHSSLATTGRYLAALDRAENPFADHLAALFDGEESDG